MPSVHSKPMYFESKQGLHETIHTDYLGDGNYHFWIENNHKIIEPTDVPYHPLGLTKAIYLPFDLKDQTHIISKMNRDFVRTNNCSLDEMMNAIKIWDYCMWGGPPGKEGACYYNALHYLLNHDLPNAHIVCGAFGYKESPTTYDLCYGY